MTNKTAFLMLISVFTLFALGGNAQPATTVIDEAELGAVKPAREYAVGLMALNRISVTDVRYGFDKHVWTLNGGGVSVLRYSSKRTFWSVGFAYAKVSTLTQEPGPDLRVIEDSITNQLSQVRVGSQTTVWRGTHFTAPISFHHLLTKSKSTNVYVTGGVALDWVRRHVLEVTSTYDGRTDYPNYGTFQEMSATVQGGLGLYQPLGENWIAMAGATLGHTFFSDLEEAVGARGAPGIASFDLRLHYRLP